MINISLYRKYWQFAQHLNFQVHLCGWAEYKGIIYNTENLLNLFLSQFNTLDVNSLKSFLHLLNGNFSFIIKYESTIVLGVDRVRSFPIIYFQFDNTLFLSDDIEAFRQNHSNIELKISDNVVEQYLSSHFIIGYHTIYKDVFSVQAGEVVEILPENVIRHQYFQWTPNMDKERYRDIPVESSIFDNILSGVIKRMINSAPFVRNWIIPLSGGHDSRLIINYLYKANVKNVIAYSYGIKNNTQSLISEKVAKALGYSWYFIEYSPEIVFEIQKCMEIYTYRKYAFNGTSTPHLQDFIAVFMLKRRGIVQSGDIFVPGHTLDFITGGHLKSGMEVCNSLEMALPFIERHFTAFGYANRSAELKKNVLSIIDTYKMNLNQIPECFNWKERQPKFIINSVRVYEYFGFEWRIPLWDNDLVDYWLKIGRNSRYGRKLFFSMQNDYLMVDELRKIPYANCLKMFMPLKTRIAAFIPLWLKKIFRYFGYLRSEYFIPEGLHLLYACHDETLMAYQNSYSVHKEVKKYLSSYPKHMKLCYFPTDSISTLLIIRDVIKG